MSDIVNSSLKTAAKGTIVVFVGMVTATLLWFVTKLLIIRNVSKEELGIYSIVVAVAGMGSIFAGLGIQDGISRYIAIFLGEGKKKDAESISRSAIEITVVSGLVLLLLQVSSSGIMSRHFFYKPELAMPLTVIAFFIFFSVLVNVFNGILRGYNIIFPKVYFYDIGLPFFFLIFISFFFLLKLTFIWLLYAYTLAMLVVLMIMGTYCIKINVINKVSLKDRKYAKELIKFSAPLLIGNMSGIVLTWCDTIILGRYTSAEDVGIYNISISLAKLLTFPLAAMEFVYLPLAGEMYAKKQYSELKRTYQVLTKWVFSATLPIFFILMFFPEMTITYLFGARFIDSSPSLRILSVCFLFHAFLGANSVLMMLLGRSRDLMNISIFGALLNVVLNYVLIKIFGLGVIGSAIATLISYFALNIIMSLILYEIRGIHPFTAKYIKPILGSIVVGLIIYMLAKSIPLYFWMVPIYFIFFICSYTFLLFLTRSIDEEDIALFEVVSNKTGLKMMPVRRLIHKFHYKHVRKDG